MEKVSQNYDPVALTRILQSLERRVEALQQPKLRRIKSVAAEAAQNLAVNEVGYVLSDIEQDFDLVVRGEDSRLYRITGAASTSGSGSGSGGTTDHGSLSGLGDDDHTQYVLRSILTTKGDLFVRDASVVNRLGVGTDGYILTADSAQALGIKWAAAAASAPVGSSYVVISLDGTLTNERNLAITGGLTLADGGANAAVTLGLPSPFTSGNVLSANGSAFVSLTPDAAGLVDKTSVQTISGIKTFSNGLISPKVYPSANSTTAIQLTKADGISSLLNIDSSNSRVKIGQSLTAVPVKTLEVAGNFEFDSVLKSSDAGMTAALAGLGAGNVDNGVHYYAVAFQTNEGSTGFFNPSVSVTVIDKTADGQVLLSGIPISTDPRVTARKIYRGLAGGTFTVLYFLATINDNTTTTYTDNIADASLVLTDAWFRKANTTAGIFTLDGADFLKSTGEFITGLDILSLSSLTSGNSNVAVGGRALQNATSGSNCTAVGYQAMLQLTTGIRNTAVGEAANYGNFTGDDNTAVGYEALRNGTSSSFASNTAVGRNSLKTLTASNSFNVAVGALSGENCQGSNNIFIGYQAGRKTVATTIGNTNIFIGYITGINTTTGADGNILIGNRVELPVSNGDNQLNLGNLLYGTGLGNQAVLATGYCKVRTAPSSTNTVIDTLIVDRGSTGTPAANMGAGVLITLESSTTEEQNAGRITCEWVVATHASRTVRSKWSVFDANGEREGFRLESDGTAVRLGAFGVAAVVRPTAYTQTYATATKTHAARTASTLTDNSAGTANTTVEALPDPADTPASADALRDDIVTNLLPALRNNFADIVAQINALKADIDNTAQFANQQCDDLQSLGWLS